MEKDVYSATSNRRRLLKATVGGAMIASCMMFAGGCATETKIVKTKPWFAGLQNAEGNTRAIGVENEFTNSAFEAPEDKIVIENEDKTKTLIAKNGRHLMIHIYTTLMEYDRQLFTDQVLSNMTKQEFRDRGLDPASAFDMLQKQEDDIVTLFGIMPQGERTPGYLMEPQGNGVFRVRVHGRRAEGLKVVGFDMVMEGGNWKLRWIVPGR